jgi:O-acetylserine/cysteine efflux transporter
VLLVVVIWGLTFVATRWALDDFSQLTALRFLIAAAPALVLARPRVPCRTLVPVGLTLFLGQFLLQFFGIALGMPPGLAAVVRPRRSSTRGGRGARPGPGRRRGW